MVAEGLRLGPWPDMTLKEIRTRWEELSDPTYDWEAVDSDKPSNIAIGFATNFAMMCPDQLKYLVGARDGSCILEYNWGPNFLEVHIDPDGTYSTLSGLEKDHPNWVERNNITPKEAVNIYFDWRQQARGQWNFPLDLTKTT